MALHLGQKTVLVSTVRDTDSRLRATISKSGKRSDRWERQPQFRETEKYYPVSAVRRRHVHTAAETTALAQRKSGTVPAYVSRRQCTAMLVKYDKLVRRMGLDAHPSSMSVELAASCGNDIGFGGSADDEHNDDDELDAEDMRADEAGALVLVRRSTLLHLLGREVEAAMDARRALALRPTMPAAHFRLGLALDAQSDFRGAAASFHEGLRHDPRSLPLRASLDTVLHRIKGAQDSDSRNHENGLISNQFNDAVSLAIQREGNNNDMQRKAAAARFSASMHALEQQLQAKAEQSRRRAAHMAELSHLRGTTAEAK